MDTAPATIEIEQLSDDELADTYIRACRVADQHALFIARLAAEFAKRNKYDDDGFVSPIDWMRFNGHMTSGGAANSVAVGEAMERMPASVEAMAEGEIGFAHLTVMARTAEALGDRFDESALIRKARENSPGKFHYICTHFRHAADPKQYADEQAEQVQQRRLKLSRWMDGTVVLSGQLDPEGGAVLLTAIEPLAHRSGAHDDRDLEQRQGDALVELAAGGGSQAQIHVTSSIETLVGLAGAPAADLELSLPISSRTVERLACDSSIARVLLDSDSMVIDVGRSKRVVSEPTRRALWVRDGSCRWPGCDRPASWSAAHHVVHWIHGGATDLDNLVLLCRRHHWMVHEGEWQLVRDEEGRMLTIPPTVTFGIRESVVPDDRPHAFDDVGIDSVDVLDQAVNPGVQLRGDVLAFVDQDSAQGLDGKGILPRLDELSDLADLVGGQHPASGVDELLELRLHEGGVSPRGSGVTLKVGET